MIILLHRRNEKLLDQEIKYLRGEFRGRNILFESDGNYKMSFPFIDTVILFFSGDYRRTAGIRSDYYNADNLDASYFIRQSADKINGIEVCSPDDIVKIILRLQKKYEDEKELTNIFESMNISKDEFITAVSLYKLKKAINEKIGIGISNDWSSAVNEADMLRRAYMRGYNEGTKSEYERISNILDYMKERMMIK